MKKIIDVLSCKCPKCKTDKIFQQPGNVFMLKMPKMYEKCTSCGYKFEKEPGFFFGAMFVSYGLGAGQMIINLLLFWSFLDYSIFTVFCIISVVSIILSITNFRLSRSIWIHLFYKE